MRSSGLSYTSYAMMVTKKRFYLNKNFDWHSVAVCTCKAFKQSLTSLFTCFVTQDGPLVLTVFAVFLISVYVSVMDSFHDTRHLVVVFLRVRLKKWHDILRRCESILHSS